MNVENDNLNIGDSAPLTALETDEHQDNDDSSLADDKNASADIDKDESPEDTTIQPSVNETSEQAGEEVKRIRYSGAARKRFKHLLALGMSKETASERCLQPVGQMIIESLQKEFLLENEATSGGIKICIVPQNFPTELWSSDQLKIIEEAIMEKIMEVKQDNPVKPKFNSCVHRSGWLAISCLDEATAEWLKKLAPTLQPWEGALLQSLQQNEMPHPEYYVAFFPDSMDYPTETMLKFLQIQNEGLSIPSWNVIKRNLLGTLIEITFSIDRRYTEELKKVGYKVNYKFGQVELWHQKNKRAAENNVKQKHPWRNAASNSKQDDAGEPSTRKRKGYFKRRREQLKALNNGQPVKKFKTSPGKRRGGGGQGYRRGSTISGASNSGQQSSYFASPWKPS